MPLYRQHYKFDHLEYFHYNNFLNHLSTKFIARRSDIIVSSTLSITLTPQDDTVEPIHFALINADEIWEYVMLRQVYRSMLIQTNKLPQRNDRLPYGQSTESSIMSSKRDDDESEYSEFDSENNTE